MKAFTRIAGTLILFVFSAGASAQGWITGAAFGQATQQNYDVGGPVATRNDTDDSYGVFGAYMISPIQGVVFSYIDLGTPTYDGPAFGNFTDRLSADGFDMSYLIGWAPGAQNRVSLFGTVGLFSWSQDVTYTELGGATVEKYKDTGTSFSFGLGTAIGLGAGGASPWGIHIEYQLFKDVGDANNSGHEYDREVFSVGADYRFGRRN